SSLSSSVSTSSRVKALLTSVVPLVLFTVVRRNLEVTEGESQIPASPGAGQRQQDITVPHRLGIGRTGGTGVSVAFRIAAVEVLDVLHFRKGPITLDFIFSERHAAAMRADLHFRRFAVVAGDISGAFAGLVEDRPTLERESEVAGGLAGVFVVLLFVVR